MGYYRPPYSLFLATPPAEEPVTLQDLRDHSRIGTTADAVLLSQHLAAVRESLEVNYNLAIITQTWEMSLDWFPREILIPKRPVKEVVSIKYLDEAAVEQTLASNTYIADVKSFQARIMPVPDASWPSTARRSGAVKVTFKAGYGDTADKVPEHVRQYIRIKVADMYEFRESTFQGPSLQTLNFAENLIASERLHSI